VGRTNDRELLASPAVLTGEAEGIWNLGMTLTGVVHPNGSTTTYYFQWGRGSSWASTRVRGPLKADTRVAVEIPGRELSPGATYRYRLVATNSFGTTVGVERTFGTPSVGGPSAVTGEARWIDMSTVTLTGMVAPGGQPMAWYFEYGLTPEYGLTTCGGVLAGDAKAVSTTERIDGLAPGTLFHYRLVARQGRKVLYGNDGTFLTPLTPSLAQRLRAVSRRATRSDAGPAPEPAAAGSPTSDRFG
jgi:YD repeat-containing protein